MKCAAHFLLKYSCGVHFSAIECHCIRMSQIQCKSVSSTFMKSTAKAFILFFFLCWVCAKTQTRRHSNWMRIICSWRLKCVSKCGQHKLKSIYVCCAKWKPTHCQDIEKKYSDGELHTKENELNFYFERFFQWKCPIHFDVHFIAFIINKKVNNQRIFVVVGLFVCRTKQ